MFTLTYFIFKLHIHVNISGVEIQMQYIYVDLFYSTKYKQKSFSIKCMVTYQNEVAKF